MEPISHGHQNMEGEIKKGEDETSVMYTDVPRTSGAPSLLYVPATYHPNLMRDTQEWAKLNKNFD